MPVFDFDELCPFTVMRANPTVCLGAYFCNTVHTHTHTKLLLYFYVQNLMVCHNKVSTHKIRITILSLSTFPCKKLNSPLEHIFEF